MTYLQSFHIYLATLHYSALTLEECDRYVKTWRVILDLGLNNIRTQQEM